MALSQPTTGLLQSIVDEKGRALKVEIRQADGVHNATLMCQSAGKLWKPTGNQRTPKRLLML